ncbi:hypothetical protein P3T23_005409 [Paraburkholderia sp. GAS448]
MNDNRQTRKWEGRIFSNGWVAAAGSSAPVAAAR